MKKKALFFLMVALLVLSLGVVAYADTPDGDTTITIFHTNDTHGRFEPSGSVIGIDTVASIVAATENALFVDAGDTIHGMPFVNIDRGINAVELLSLAGLDLMSPGNHEFNFGLDRLLELEALAGFGMISANVFWRDDSSLVFDAYVIIEVDGVTLGFFGLITTAAYTTTHPNNIVDVYFGNPIPAAQAAVAALQAHEVDVIIAITHVGLDGANNTPAIARAVPEIDLIIDGHSHDLGSQTVNGVVIAQAGQHGQHLGRVDITVSEDGEVTLEASVIDHEYARENFGPAPAVTAAMEAMNAQLAEAMGVVVAYSPVDLVGERELIRTQEMPLGNLVAESMAWVSDAQLALMNSGGIRDCFDAG
ncbi:MAG: bifunctional metallophosphatase/5'-nucleotidase, partial [Defluviitaleaceae bacterium]|nr:bifunctional metallophosphatase/5'-nucleotidase [Defluviitaleaceae bacterium]